LSGGAAKRNTVRQSAALRDFLQLSALCRADEARQSLIFAYKG
jgi:hypothetical protein